jgi:hypothetical protein
MATSNYQIEVRDNDGERIAVFAGRGRGESGGGLQSLTYTKRLRTPGSGTTRIFGDDERIELLELLDSGPADTHLDYWFEFWRQDPIGGIDWYRDWVVFHRWDGFVQLTEGEIAYEARGRGLNDLLQAEPIRWYKGSTQAQKNAVAETAAKEYVNENVGPGATVVAGRDRAGNFQGLTVQVTGGTGNAWEGDRSNENLLDVLIELAEFAPGDFSLEPASNHPDAIAMEFQWRENQWGLDKTFTNGVRPAVVFAPENGNVENIRMMYSRLGEVNVVDVGGPGKNDARIYVSRTSGAESDSPWARRAVFRNGSSANNDSTAKLQDIGDNTLDKQRSRRVLTFNAKQTTATRYRRDWDLGDLVTVEFLGRSYDKKIVGVTIGLNAEGDETISVEAQDV